MNNSKKEKDYFNSDTKKVGKRIKIKPQVVSAETPTLPNLLTDALIIIGNELSKYRSKTERGISLDPKEARVITNYLDVLTKASRESREQARAEDFSHLSNEELREIANRLTVTEAPKEPKAEE